MIRSIVYRLPKESKEEMIKRYNLQVLMSNDRTTICQNKDMRVSFDKLVARVLLFENTDNNLIEELNTYFYGENYYENI